MKYRVPKGLFDITPLEKEAKDLWKHSQFWREIEDTIHEHASEYGFHEIRTPIFESTELFQRSVGTDSDIVSKEMYEFKDRAKRSLCLRPEGTASVMRSLVEKNAFSHASIQKFYYIGPMFRYERPQAGRYRQHHQFGAEAVGIKAPEQDAEIIDFLYSFFCKLQLKDLTVKINTLGNKESRQQFRSQLIDYLHPKLDQLSEDSQKRFTNNPLRILDSKSPADQAVLQHAPKLMDVLDSASKDRFEQVLHILKLLNIPYTVDPLLVRGLDYYNETVFEIQSSVLGAQNSIGGGGRYDGLVHTLGGPDIPAVGFGSGLERIIQTALKQEVLPSPFIGPDLYIIPHGKAAIDRCLSITRELRVCGVRTEMDFSKRKIGKMMQTANQQKALFTVIIGDEELQTKIVKIKQMDNGKTLTLQLDNFVESVGDILMEREFQQLSNSEESEL